MSSRILALVAAIALAWSPAARATTLVRMTVAGMSQLASEVDHGTVTHVESRWTADRSQVLTYVTLDVADRLKGEGPDRITFAQWGGQIGDEAFTVIGSATFREGEEVVVFLDALGGRPEYGMPTDLWILGLSQGKWEVETGPGGERVAVNAATRGAHLVGTATTDAPDSIPLPELARRVRAAWVENLQQLGGN